MEYKCNCKPIQKNPHIVKSAGIKRLKHILIVMEYNKLPISCCGIKIPKRKYCLYFLNRKIINFGSYIKE